MKLIQIMAEVCLYDFLKPGIWREEKGAGEGETRPGAS